MFTGRVYHRHLPGTELAGELVGGAAAARPAPHHHQGELVLRSQWAALELVRIRSPPLGISGSGDISAPSLTGKEKSLWGGEI